MLGAAAEDARIIETYGEHLQRAAAGVAPPMMTRYGEELAEKEKNSGRRDNSIPRHSSLRDPAFVPSAPPGNKGLALVQLDKLESLLQDAVKKDAAMVGALQQHSRELLTASDKHPY